MTHLWVYLHTNPLLWLLATLLAFLAASWLYQRTGQHPLLHPVATAIPLLIGVLLLTRTSYQQYFEGAQFIHFLLGPVTVALALPLYANLAFLKKLWKPLLVALLAGSISGVLVAVWLAHALGLPFTVLRSMAPKSVTSPIAMGVAEQIQGNPSLAAAIVLVTGIAGAIFAKGWLDLLRVRHEAVRGFAMGLAAHGVGTARAFQMSETTGAFAGLAMGLNGLATSVLMPLLLRGFPG